MENQQKNQKKDRSWWNPTKIVMKIQKLRIEVGEIQLNLWWKIQKKDRSWWNPTKIVMN